MRRGFGGGIRRTDDGRIESVNLGADYCSEHEWGIKGLERDFGLSKRAKPGVPRRKIRRYDGGVIGGFDKKSVTLWYDRMWRYADDVTKVPRHIDQELRLHEAPMVGGWSDGDFGVRFAKSNQAIEDVRDLREAFERKDIAFLFQNVGDNPFANAGLNLVIVSRLPKDIVDDLAEKDADHDALLKASAKTGIEKRLDKASEKQGPIRPGAWGKRFGWYALRPSWAETIETTVDGRNLSTKYPVIYFLNPQDQKTNNSGWFTVEDLDAWTRGEGPIPKQQEG